MITSARVQVDSQVPVKGTGACYDFFLSLE